MYDTYTFCETHQCVQIFKTHTFIIFIIPNIPQYTKHWNIFVVPSTPRLRPVYLQCFEVTALVYVNLIRELIGQLMDGAEARNVGVRSRPWGWGADADWRTSYGRIEHAHRWGDVLVQPAAFQEFVEGHHAILVFVHFLYEKIIIYG